MSKKKNITLADAIIDSIEKIKQNDKKVKALLEKNRKIMDSFKDNFEKNYLKND